jgi:hypothetical protein
MKNILTEINRYREISGLPLLNEAWIDDVIRKVLPDFDDILTGSRVTGDAQTLYDNILDDSLGKIYTIEGDLISNLDDLARAIEFNELSDEAINMLIKNVMDVPSLRSNMVNQLISSSKSLLEIDDYIKNIDDEISRLTGGKELPSEQLLIIKNKFKDELSNATYNDGTKLGDNVIEEFNNRIDNAFKSKIGKLSSVDRSSVSTQLSQITKELRDLPIGKKLVQEGKYKQFSTRLENLDSILKNEDEMRRLLGDTNYEKFKRQLDDFSQQSLNYMQRLYIKTIDKTGKFFSIVYKYMGISGVIAVFLALASLIDYQFNMFDLPIGKHVVGGFDIISCTLLGIFCKEAEDYKEDRGWFKTQKDDSDSEVENDDITETPEKTIERFKKENMSDWSPEEMSQVSDFKYENGDIIYKENWGDKKIVKIPFKAK